MKQTPGRTSAPAAGHAFDARPRHADRSPRSRGNRSDPDALTWALRTTLADDRFVLSPRTSRLLVHLVERTIAGDAEPLRSVRFAYGPSGADGDDATLLRILLTRLARLLAERRIRVGDRTDVLALAPLGHVVVERAEALPACGVGIGIDGGPHGAARGPSP